jgi:hypothetical protein
VLTQDDLLVFMRKLKNTLALAGEATAIKEALRGFGAVDAPTAKRGKAVEPEKVLAALKGANDGASLGDLANKLADTKPRVAATLQRLRAAKKVKLKGKRRLALWFAA